MDLTGLPTFRFKFTHVDHVQEVESGALFDRLVYADTNRCVAVASTPGEDRFSENGLAPSTTSDGGLVPGHAYALIAACSRAKIRFQGPLRHGASTPST